MSRFRLPFSLDSITSLFSRKPSATTTRQDPRDTRLMFTTSEHNVSVVLGNRLFSVPSSEPAFAALREHLLSVPEGSPHSYDLVENLVNKPKALSRLTEGEVSVSGGTVYYRGNPVHSTLATKLVQMVDSGLDASPWARFLDRVMANPDERSRKCLFDFLEQWEAPITEDGHFIAFKRVRSDWTSIHRGPEGPVSHKPGEVVQMDRSKVDSNPNNTCSSGLHCCATQYLGRFFAGDNSMPVITVKVDPADVCAVPADYGFAKMRVCQYVVLGLASPELYENAHKVPVAYVGTEAATGDVVDMDGKPICYNANDFAENWKRSSGELTVGDLVVMKPDSDNSDLPVNGYMVGELMSSETFDEDTIPFHLDWEDFEGMDMVTVWEIEWQDGSVSDEVFTYPNSASENDIDKVEFIGETESVPEDEEERTICSDCEEVIPNWQYLCDDCQETRDSEEDEKPVCGDCGSTEVDFEGETCDDCEDEEMRIWEEEMQADSDAMDEADHIAETGLTRSGEPAPEHWTDPYAYSHNTARFVEEEEKAPMPTLPAPDDAAEEQDDEPSEMAFTRNGVTYGATAIKAGIQKHGQRGYSRLTGIPRTTLQDWMLKIEVTED